MIFSNDLRLAALFCDITFVARHFLLHLMTTENVVINFFIFQVSDHELGRLELNGNRRFKMIFFEEYYSGIFHANFQNQERKCDPSVA